MNSSSWQTTTYSMDQLAIGWPQSQVVVTNIVDQVIYRLDRFEELHPRRGRDFEHELREYIREIRFALRVHHLGHVPFELRASTQVERPRPNEPPVVRRARTRALSTRERRPVRSRPGFRERTEP